MMTLWFGEYINNITFSYYLLVHIICLPFPPQAAFFDFAINQKKYDFFKKRTNFFIII